MKKMLAEKPDYSMYLTTQTYLAEQETSTKLFKEEEEAADFIASTTTPILFGKEDDSKHFILIPLATLLTIIILSALVYLMARNRRRLTRIYCKRRNAPRYTYDNDSDESPLDQTGNDDRDDYYDFDDPTECLLKGKLQIDNHYETYRTTQVTQMADKGTSEVSA